MLRIDTQALLMACHDDLLQKHPRTLVAADELSSHVGDYYNVVRDMKVALVGEWLFRHFGEKLADCFDLIAEKVAKVDEPYYVQMMSGEEVNAESVAHALAVVLFYRAEDRGWIHYRYEMTEDDAAAWLDEYAPKVARQPILFAELV